MRTILISEITEKLKNGELTCSKCDTTLSNENWKLLTKKGKRNRHYVCRKCLAERLMRWYYLHQEDHLKKQRKYNAWIRKLCILYYSNGTMTCALCPFSDIRALTIDHPNGGGNKHRKELGGHGHAIYFWLYKNNFPPGFRVLCMNCQFIVKDDKDETESL